MILPAALRQRRYQEHRPVQRLQRERDRRDDGVDLHRDRCQHDQRRQPKLDDHLTRVCTLGRCAGGNGTFISRSTSLVTNVTQCNGTGNKGGTLLTCSASITNNIRSASGTGSQVTSVPSGGVESGGGSTAGLNRAGLLTLGGGLLLAAAMSARFGRRVSRRQ
jgi:hypothetical protein